MNLSNNAINRSQIAKRWRVRLWSGSSGSNPGPVKLDTELPTTRQRCDISLKRAVSPRSTVAAMGSSISSHAYA